MGIKVAKFGGSSVADAMQINKIKNIIEADKDIKYVVVSAPGKRFPEDSKITDLLYLCRTHIEQMIPYHQVFQVIADRFTSLEINLGVNVNIREELEIIRKNIEQGASADYIASRGEYLNAKLIAAYLGFEFVDASALIKFSDKGKFKEEMTNEIMAEKLGKLENAVIPGFYGSKIEGKIKTFSRGGSDITGALVARAVGADVYENWTDVSGFLMADPRIVDNPKPISSISYKELRELSYMGASVLHEDAIYPARIANIPINIRNTNRPEDPGTMITATAESDERRVISGIAGHKDFTVVNIEKGLLATERGFIRRLAGILEDMDVSVEHLPTGIDSVSVVIDNNMLDDGKIDELVEEVKRQLKPDSVEIYTDMALIATVGAGMAQRAGTSAKLFGALASADINVRMIDQGSSELNIIIGVDNKNFEKAIKAIYEAFDE